MNDTPQLDDYTFKKAQGTYDSMTVIKQHNGILISDVIDNQRVKRLYIGCSVKHAIDSFKTQRRLVKEGKASW